MRAASGGRALRALKKRRPLTGRRAFANCAGLGMRRFRFPSGLEAWPARGCNAMARLKTAGGAGVSRGRHGWIPFPQANFILKSALRFPAHIGQKNGSRPCGFEPFCVFCLCALWLFGARQRARGGVFPAAAHGLRHCFAGGFSCIFFSPRRTLPISPVRNR